VNEAPGLTVVFAGTPAFAVPALEAIASSRHRVVAAYAQPDRRAGRGLRTEPGPVKQAAIARGIPVEQPATLRDAAAVERLAAWRPDVMVVAAYGLLLPQAVLDVPRLGCLNIHASLLPRWRGAAPIQRAILAGDRETGITIMRMEAGLDTGPMLLWQAVEIGAEETAGSLHDRLAGLGATLILQALDRLEAGTADFVPQDDAQASYARKLAKAEGLIDWTRPAAELARQVRAFDPWPVAETRLDGGQLRIWSARALPPEGPALPGTVLSCDGEGIMVAAGEGRLLLRSVQLPGRRAVSAAQFARSQDLTGRVLG
jgi:methionyl-tRNA formyltransferase